MASKAGLTAKQRAARAAKLRRRAVVKGLAPAPARGSRGTFATFAAMSDPGARELDELAELAPEESPATLARRMEVDTGSRQAAFLRGEL